MITITENIASYAKLKKILIQNYSSEDRIAIIGGHYILFYNQAEDKLIPLISKELKGRLKSKAELTYESFPTDSFTLSMFLYKKLHKKTQNIKNVFLLNDHRFQSYLFQFGISDLIKNRGGILRKDFYNNNQIPKSFIKIMKDQNIIPEVAILSNRKTYTDKKEINYLFSEHKLRKKFDRRTKKELIGQFDNFEERKRDNSNKTDLFYRYTSNYICLTEDGSCACSGEVIQMNKYLEENKFNKIILIVPIKCYEAVKSGAMASLSSSPNINSITVISSNNDKFSDKNRGYNFFKVSRDEQ